MATERELRRQMNQLRDEIKALQRQSKEREKELQRRFNAQMQEMTERMRKEMVRQREETEADYNRRIANLQSNYNAQVAQAMESLKKNAEDAMRAQQDKFRQLERYNAELIELLEKTKKKSERQADEQRALALELKNEMLSSRERTQTSPHAFFFNGEFSLIDAQADMLDVSIQNEMFQAAAADASSAALQFDLLYIKAIQAMNDWSQAFTEYRAIITLISERIIALETRLFETDRSSAPMTQEELQFWSSDTYLAFRDKVMKADDEIMEIEALGIPAYLMKAASENRRAIYGKLRDAYKWNDEFTGISTCILAERTLSDLRWRAGKAAKKIMTEYGYSTVGKPGFRCKTTGQMVFKNNVDPMDCYDLTVTLNGMDKVTITFCPVRTNGVAVRNICYVSADPVTIRDGAFINDIIQTIVKRLTSDPGIISCKVYVNGISYCKGCEQIKQQSEEQQKKQPNPQEQIKLAQKRFQ